MALEVLLVVATLAGIVVQASVGFGFAFFVAPVAVALFRPEQAVTLLLVLGLAINSLVLFAERRRPQIESRSLALMLAAALPGLILGAVIVHALSTSAMQVAVGVLILLAALPQARRADVEVRSSQQPRLIASGLAAGLLTTATSLNGPAVVLGLVSVGWRGSRLRDGVAAAFLGLSVLGTIALVLVGGSGRSSPPVWSLAVCVPLIAVGHRIGAAIFRRLADDAHRRLVIAASVVAGLVSVVAGLV